MTEVNMSCRTGSRVQCPSNCEYSWETNCWRDGD